MAPKLCIFYNQVRILDAPWEHHKPHGTPRQPMAPHGTKIYVYLLARKSFRWVIIGFKPHGIKIRQRSDPRS